MHGGERRAGGGGRRGIEEGEGGGREGRVGEGGGREGRVRGGGGGVDGGREGGIGGTRTFYLRAELIKCIDPNEGEALKAGREGGEGWGRGAAEHFTWRAELIKCIDPNEGEALRRGSTFKPGGLAPHAPLFHRLWGAGGQEVGRREGGYRLIISVSWLSTTETHELVTLHFRDLVNFDWLT